MARVLYIAVDACDADLMLAFAAQGHCPNLAALLSESAVTDTVAPYGTYVGSSWMTITTGSDVGTHRYWNWMEIDPATYELVGTTPRDARGRPFWEHLSDAGRRVAVLDVPHAGVPTDFNGVLLKEWGCHDRHDGTASYPASLLDDLDRTFGRHPVGCRDHPNGDPAFAPCDYTMRDGWYRTVDEERRLLDLLRDGIDAKHRVSAQLLADGPWDLFATVLGEAHCVGHQFWHVHDERHPRHDPAARQLLGDPVADVYARLDAVIGDLVAQVPPDTTVYVQMNHGMGPHFDGDHLLDQLLERIDDSMRGRFTPGRTTRIGRRVYDSTPDALRGIARRSAAAAARGKARRGAPVVAGRAGPDPDRRFFQIPGNTTVGAVRFNVLGREERGIVRPGADLDRLMSTVSDALLEVIDIDSGRPLVRAVRRSDDVFEHAHGDRLPDLFVEWDRSSLVERVWSPTTGTVAAPYDHWRTGDHHERGVLLARGPGIAPGHRPASIVLQDVAPTIAAALDVTLPDVDGRVHWDLVGDAHRQLSRALADVAAGRAERRIDALEAENAQLRRRVELGERERLITTTMAWLGREPVHDDVLISVVTPTYARPDRLEEAIRSVIAQRHQSWEMVIVDDGSDTAAAVVAGFDDERVRLIDADHGGVCRARNIALEHVKGEIVTYLDDDNWLDPGWLHAVEWAFRNHPASSVLYGARVLDDVTRAHGMGDGGWPFLQFNAFDRAALEQDNFADMGVLAHRADHPARFDDPLVECGDWDFFLSLTEHETPLELPAIAFYYRTDGTDRLTGQQPEDAARVRQKWAARRAAPGGIGASDHPVR